MLTEKNDIIATLQREILLLQGFKPSTNVSVDLELGPMRQAFPNGSFPRAAIHEFLAAGAEDAAATSGFVAGLLSPLMRSGSISLWIGASRMLFPPALKRFGISPDQFIFIDVQKEKQVVGVMDEALKCGALTAVVGEMQDLGFTASRRLQLAVEQSQVTGFILRQKPRTIGTMACVTRWKITSLPSAAPDGLPGIGFPHWKVELLRVRNGKPGSWHIRWTGNGFEPVYTANVAAQEQQRKTG